LDTSDLMRMLEDRLLQSGFDRDPFDPDPEWRPSMEDLHEAIAESLLDNELVTEEMIRQAMEAEDWLDSELGQAVKRLAQRLADDGYIRPIGQEPSDEEASGQGYSGDTSGHTQFQLTDKAIDFLGYRTLRDLLGAAGKSSVGSHDTRFTAAGVEAVGQPKRYEFGDSLNLAVSETLKRAARHGIGRLELEEDDLYVMQSEYRS